VKVTAAARWELRVAVGLWEKLGGSETRPYVTWSALANLSSLLKDRKPAEELSPPQYLAAEPARQLQFP